MTLPPAQDASAEKDEPAASSHLGHHRPQRSPEENDDANDGQTVADEEVEGKSDRSKLLIWTRKSFTAVVAANFDTSEQNEKRAIAFRPSRRGPLEILPDARTDFLTRSNRNYTRDACSLMKLQEDYRAKNEAR